MTLKVTLEGILVLLANKYPKVGGWQGLFVSFNIALLINVNVNCWSHWKASCCCWLIRTPRGGCLLIK